MSIIRQMITLKSLYRNIISRGFLYQLDRRAVFFAKCDECTLDGLFGGMITVRSLRAVCRSSTSKATCGTVLRFLFEMNGESVTRKVVIQ
jgi:hypothetical protein